MTEIGYRHWTVALLVASTAHFAAAFLLHEPEKGAEAVGLGGIEVSLGPAGSAPGSIAAATEISERSPIDPEDAASVHPQVVPIEAVEVMAEAATLPKPVAVEARPPTETAEAVSPPVEVAAVTPETVTRTEDSPWAELLRMAEPKLRPVRDIAPRQTATVEPVSARPSAPPALVKMVKPMKALPVRATASAPGQGGKAGTRESPNAGSASQLTGGGTPGAAADYFTLVRLWLEKHKRYPRHAQLRRQEGTALLRFVMNRRGRVLSYRIEQGSGYKLLDQEVEDMIQRASPLPAVPNDIAQAPLELLVPVEFHLR